ncbi:hypothetical protein FQZ97_854860 [compost metagenome]
MRCTTRQFLISMSSGCCPPHQDGTRWTTTPRSHLRSGLACGEPWRSPRPWVCWMSIRRFCATRMATGTGHGLAFRFLFKGTFLYFSTTEMAQLPSTGRSRTRTKPLSARALVQDDTGPRPKAWQMNEPGMRLNLCTTRTLALRLFASHPLIGTDHCRRT